MQADRSKVSYLKEFYTVAEIRAFWQELGDTDRSFAADPLQVSSHGQDGESTGAILVRTQEDAAAWMLAAECAYKTKKAEEDGEPEPGIDPDSLGRGTDFSQRMVRV